MVVAKTIDKTTQESYIDIMETAKRKCTECGSDLIHSSYSPKYQVGELTILDPGKVLALKCTKCDTYEVPALQLHLSEARVANVLLIKHSLTGEALKFVRKVLSLTRKELSTILGIAYGQILSWESTGPATKDNLLKLSLLFLLGFSENDPIGFEKMKETDKIL